jgi:hypothetical protein
VRSGVAPGAEDRRFERPESGEDHETAEQQRQREGVAGSAELEDPEGATTPASGAVSPPIRPAAARSHRVKEEAHGFSRGRNPTTHDTNSEQ